MLNEKLDTTGLSYVDEKIYSYYKFQGAHYPFYLTLDGQSGRSNDNDQVYMSLSIIERFMQDLKQAGVYDNYTIIVIADK